MTRVITYLVWMACLLPLYTMGQFSIDWNAWLDMELSKAGEDSHYCYNQIWHEKTDWRFGISEINILTTMHFNAKLHFNLRGQLSRQRGNTLSWYKLPSANLSYEPEHKKWNVALGRFITPFAKFAEQQHSKERIFINLPLSHSYYTNVSDKVGFVEQLGEERFVLDSFPQWGTTIHYYGAYSTGLRFQWNIEPEKVVWTTALTTAATNSFTQSISLDNWGIVTRLSLQPTYFWEQQVSFSHGTFKSISSLAGRFDIPLQQTLLGTDFTLGYGFWEMQGEVIGAFYKAPQYEPTNDSFSAEAISLTGLFLRSTIQYEAPFLSGLYLAYGIEHLAYNELRPKEKWDDNVLRHNFGLGYKITDFLLLRTNYMLQDVEQHPIWEQSSWRTSLTIHY